MSRQCRFSSYALALRAHVRQIVESPAFRSSKRSQEFLQFIVDRALESHFDELKERALGVELFGRAPSYDTGGDSIIRVMARDLRKRLIQFYAESGRDSGFRIELPPVLYSGVSQHSHGVCATLGNRSRNEPQRDGANRRSDEGTSFCSAFYWDLGRWRCGSGCSSGISRGQ